MSVRRLQLDLRDINMAGMNAFRNITTNDNMHLWQGDLVLENELDPFKIQIVFPVDYPFKPPRVTFLTEINHPNVDENFQVHLEIFKPGHWKPAIKMDQVIESLVSFLAGCLKLKNALENRFENITYGETRSGQVYAITVSQMPDLKYEIGLYLDEDHMAKVELYLKWTGHVEEDGTPPWTPIWTRVWTRIWTRPRTLEFDEEGVNEWINLLKMRLNWDRLMDYDMFDFFGYPTRPDKFGFYWNNNRRIVNIPDDCRENPHNYLKPGDHVQISRKRGTYTHDAIYIGKVDDIGEPQVIHIFGPNKEDSNVQMDEWKTFIGNSRSGTVSVFVYRLRQKSAENIVLTAKSFLKTRSFFGAYHLKDRNCQHFASFCATGNRFSYGIQSAYTTGRVIGAAGIVAAGCSAITGGSILLFASICVLTALTMLLVFARNADISRSARNARIANIKEWSRITHMRIPYSRWKQERDNAHYNEWSQTDMMIPYDEWKQERERWEQ